MRNTFLALFITSATLGAAELLPAKFDNKALRAEIDGFSATADSGIFRQSGESEAAPVDPGADKNQVTDIFPAHVSANAVGNKLPLYSVPLKNPTATYSQTFVGDFAIGRTIDGNTEDNLGWAIAPNVRGQAAAYETASDVGYSGGTRVIFKLSCLHHSAGFGSHLVGRFRLSLTTDPRSTFADGLPSEGDVTANWSVIQPLAVTSQNGAQAKVQADRSILIVGTPPDTDVITVEGFTTLTGITGVRLETLQDPSLPLSGPGFDTDNGNFVISEFTFEIAPEDPKDIYFIEMPKDQIVPFGGTAQFRAQAASEESWGYSWTHNGQLMPGKTRNTLTVENVHGLDEGVYAITVHTATKAITAEARLFIRDYGRPIPLASATASFSQAGFSVASAIDGIADDQIGWAILPEIKAQTAVFETTTNIGSADGLNLTFRLSFLHPNHLLGRFRISATSDPRDSFGDGLSTGGNLGSNWVVLKPFTAYSEDGTFLEILDDGSIRAQGIQSTSIFNIRVTTDLPEITGIRLEALQDPLLPFNGPGWQVSNGNFVLSEFEVLTATLPNKDIPSIILPLADQYVAPREKVQFRVEADGPKAATYEWEFNGQVIPGATSDTLNLNGFLSDGVRFSDAGVYKVSIRNGSNVVESSAHLSVQSPLEGATATFSQADHPPFTMLDGVLNDEKGWAIFPNITSQTAVFHTVPSFGSGAGTVLAFVLHFNQAGPGSPSPLGRFRLSVTTDPANRFGESVPGAGAVSGNWTVLPVRSARARYATLTNLPDGSILATGAVGPKDVYTIEVETTIAGITGVRLEALHDPSLPGNGPGRAENGNFVLSEFQLFKRPGAGPLIVQQPDSVRVFEGSSAVFEVRAWSFLPMNYQWFRNGAPVAGATNATLFVSAVTPQTIGTYTVNVTNSAGVNTTAGAVLDSISPSSATAARLFVSNQSNVFSRVLDVRGEPVEGPRYLAQVFLQGPDGEKPASPAVPFLTGEYAGAFSPINVVLPNVNAGDRVRVRVVFWDSAFGPSFADAVANHGDRGESEVIDTPTGGAQFPPVELSTTRLIRLVGPPRITAELANASAYTGETITLNPLVIGTEPLTFQWLHNGIALPGRDSQSLTLTNLQLSDAGTYSLLVSNQFGTATSAILELSLSTPDTLPPIIRIDSPLPGATFSDSTVLRGTISDDSGILNATLFQNDSAAVQLSLTNGSFEADIALARGTNILRIVATDSFANTSTGSVTVLQLASQLLSVGQVGPFQEGSRIGVPVSLQNRGGLLGVSFGINYDAIYLENPEVVWDDSVGNAFKEAILTPPASLKLSVASNRPLLQPTQRLATVFFRLRSVPKDLTTPLSVTNLNVFSTSGDSLSDSTDSQNGSVRITARKYVGDINANDRLDIADATTILRFATGALPARSWDRIANDLNTNRVVDFGDVIRVLRVVVGIDPQPAAVIAPIDFGPLPAASVSLSSDKAELIPGDLLHIKVTLDRIPKPPYGASFKLSYPAAILSLENPEELLSGSVAPTNALALWNAPESTPGDTNGTVTVAIDTDRPWPATNGILTEFTFRVLTNQSNNSGTLILSGVEFSTGDDLVPAADATLSFLDPSTTVFSLLGAPDSSGSFRISLSGPPSSRYEIDFSEDFTVWTSLGAPARTNEVFTLLDPLPGKPRHRFYRARLVR